VVVILTQCIVRRFTFYSPPPPPRFSAAALSTLLSKVCCSLSAAAASFILVLVCSSLRAHTHSGNAFTGVLRSALHQRLAPACCQRRLARDHSCIVCPGLSPCRCAVPRLRAVTPSCNASLAFCAWPCTSVLRTLVGAQSQVQVAGGHRLRHERLERVLACATEPEPQSMSTVSPHCTTARTHSTVQKRFFACVRNSLDCNMKYSYQSINLRKNAHRSNCCRSARGPSVPCIVRIPSECCLRSKKVFFRCWYLGGPKWARCAHRTI
jgi:hypothetical protein